MLVAALCGGLVAILPMTVLAAAAPALGSAANFAVLAASTVTNTGPTSIAGQLGLYPGTAVTGFPPGVSGVQHTADAIALQAKNDLAAAYLNAAGQTCTAPLTGDLGGRTLTAGVYCFSSSAQLTARLTLDGPNVYVFQIGSTLVTAPGASVFLTNGALPGQVFWQVGSSATIDTSTHFAGNIMALASITMNTGASLDGRALARTGAVTLQSNVIDLPTPPPPPVLPPPPPAPALPPPPVALPAPPGLPDPLPAGALPNPALPAPAPPAPAAPAASVETTPAPGAASSEPATGSVAADHSLVRGRQGLRTAVDSSSATCQGGDCAPSLCPALVPASLSAGCATASRLPALIGLAATGLPVLSLAVGLVLLIAGLLVSRRRRVLRRPSD